MKDIINREQNTRAGFVYIISNLLWKMLYMNVSKNTNLTKLILAKNSLVYLLVRFKKTSMNFIVAL